MGIATLPDSPGWKPSGIPPVTTGVAVLGQFQLSFPGESRWVPASPARCARSLSVVRGIGGGNCAAKDSAIRKHRTSEPIVEHVMKVERLSPHPFQPSRREKVKQEDRGCSRNQGQTSWLMKMIFPSSLAFLLERPVLIPLRPSSEHILIVRAPGARDRHGCHSSPSNREICLSFQYSSP